MATNDTIRRRDWLEGEMVRLGDLIGTIQAAMTYNDRLDGDWPLAIGEHLTHAYELATSKRERFAEEYREVHARAAEIESTCSACGHQWREHAYGQPVACTLCGCTELPF